MTLPSNLLGASRVSPGPETFGGPGLSGRIFRFIFSLWEGPETPPIDRTGSTEIRGQHEASQ